MAMVMLIGSDTALLEGLAQTLSAAGHSVTLAPSVPEAGTIPGEDRPLIVAIDRDALHDSGLPLRLIMPGGAFILYRKSDRSEPLPAAVQRAALADLLLPLERQRLVALVQHVEARAFITGRSLRCDPTDEASDHT
jgi:DNA-binding NtrC family response regulator